MKLQISSIFLVLVLFLVNILIYFLLLPYAQETANTHINSGSFFGNLFYLISSLLFIIFIYFLFAKKNYQTSTILLLFGFTFLFWGIKLKSLECLGCLNAG